MRPRTLVGVFHGVDAAYAALRRIDASGDVSPQHVGLIAGDPELAREVGAHDHVVAGAVGGFILGLVLAAFYVAIGGPSLHRDGPPPVLGTAFVSFGLAFLRLLVWPRVGVPTKPERAVEHARPARTAAHPPCGTGPECDRARRLLDGAADEIVEETGD